MIFGLDQKSESEIESTDKSHENMHCGVCKVKILLCVLCVSVVKDCLENNHRGTENTEVAQRRSHTDFSGNGRPKAITKRSSHANLFPSQVVDGRVAA